MKSAKSLRCALAAHCWLASNPNRFIWLQTFSLQLLSRVVDTLPLLHLHCTPWPKTQNAFQHPFTTHNSNPSSPDVVSTAKRGWAEPRKSTPPNRKMFPTIATHFNVVPKKKGMGVSNVIKEPLWVPQRTFHWPLLKRPIFFKCEEHMKNLISAIKTICEMEMFQAC